MWKRLNKILSPLSKSDKSTEADVLFYPPFDNEKDFSDQVYRISWYLPENSGVTVRLLSTSSFKLLTPDDSFKSMEQRIPTNIIVDKVKKTDRLAIEQFLEGLRFMAFWQNDGQKEISELISEKKLRIMMVDKNDPSRREAFEYCKFLHDLELYGKRKEKARAEETKFGQILSKYCGFKKSYIFGTGPSLQEAFNFDLSDGLRIVCNSIVKNRELLEHIKPHIIVAGDPVFHFGCSRYAEQFRKELIEVIQKYGMDFFYPFFYARLFESHYLDLVDRSFSIPQVGRSDFNLDLSREYVLKGMDNILTLLMLPLATTLTDEIRIIGCDGRKPDEDYFWKHHTSSQYDDLMESVKKCHPAFFNHVVYEDYYDQHCENLEILFGQAERKGKHIKSITKSYIPALLARN
jgi:hypothetical protein